MRRFMLSESFIVHRIAVSLIILAVLAAFLIPESSPFAKNPYRRAFFDHYPVAVGTAIDDVPTAPEGLAGMECLRGQCKGRSAKIVRHRIHYRSPRLSVKSEMGIF